MGKNIPEHNVEEKKEEEGVKEEEEEREEEEKIEVSPFSVKEKEEASAKKMAEESDIFNERVINYFLRINKFVIVKINKGLEINSYFIYR